MSKDMKWELDVMKRLDALENPEDSYTMPMFRDEKEHEDWITGIVIDQILKTTSPACNCGDKPKRTMTGINITKHCDTCKCEYIAPGDDGTLPLNVRVAKALGHEIAWVQVGIAVGYYCDKCCTAQHNIPAYDTDLTLAMGALEEYCEKNKLMYCIELREWGYSVTLRLRLDVHTIKVVGDAINKSLPTASCESIAKHSEGVK